MTAATHVAWLPEAALVEVGTKPLGLYLHVPFCAARCGYCDFTTYTPGELGGRPGTSRETYLAAAVAEIELAARTLGPDRPPVSTVFVGGGTPTLLDADQLTRLLRAIEDHLGLAPDAEVTTEANPESVSPATLGALRVAGFTRVSLGMQSAVPHVLAALDRRHTPGRAVAAAREATAAGFDHVSLDLIYGAPGESDADWQQSLDAAVAAGTDHLSAYALVVEIGTRLARQVKAGQIAMPDDDVLAERYLMAERTLAAAGLSWYEVSNWATGPAARCRHNELYWDSAHWWGVGPGAHSHVGGVRWWNVKHPASYASRLAEGGSPAQDREVLTDADRALEELLLGIRRRSGLSLAPGLLAAAAQLAADGLLEAGALEQERAVLTLRGRLLADAVVRALAAAADQPD